MKKHLLRFLLFLCGAGIGLIIIAGIVTLRYLSTFLSAADISFSQFKTIVSDAYENKDQFADSSVTFLILGLDQRADALESTLLTDTIILATLNTTSGTFTMIPIPRDVWIPDLKTKVNALYFYGEQRDDTNGINFTIDEITKLTRTPVHYHIVMNYNDLDDLIDTVGGIIIDVPHAFTDTEFPNEAYISDPSQPIYKTISFQSGVQHMTGDQALTYVRSRKSDDISEGTDVARSSRQVQVLNAVMQKMRQRSFITSPEKLGNTYRFWHDAIQTNITDHEIGSLVLAIDSSTLSIQSRAIPTDFDDTYEPILINPPISKYGLWVWELNDPTGEELRKFIELSLQ